MTTTDTRLSLRVRDLVRICEALPSAWQAQTLDGGPVYIRYRYGRLKVYVGVGPDVRTTSDFGELVYLRDFHRRYHGLMSTGEMLRHTGIEPVGSDGGATRQPRVELSDGAWEIRPGS